MKAKTVRTSFALVCIALFLSSCAGLPTSSHKAEDATSATYQAVSFATLPGWPQDNLANVQQALLKSCQLQQKRTPSQAVVPASLGGIAGDWQQACRGLETTPDVRGYLETHFTPYQVTTPNGGEGLFTGYYVPQLRGSLTKTARYNVPLYKRPPELVMVDLGLFRPTLKGQRIAGEVIGGQLKPYANRAAIDRGALAGRGLELLWLDDADAAFFLAVQGSGQVQLENGETVRVGYDGQNGHVYNAIGKELIKRGALTAETVSLQTINAWLKTHPAEAQTLRDTNPSYVFFKLQANDGAQAGAIGAQGVTLTPTRSLAVDPHFVPYGTPVWLDVAPVTTGARIQRLMIAQDTGGAIHGPVRGDFFWGSGAEAEQNAGVMKSRGKFYLLLPNTIRIKP